MFPQDHSGFATEEKEPVSRQLQVQCTCGERHYYADADWNSMNDGTLQILDSDGDAMAEYPAGQWLYVRYLSQ